MSSSLSLVRHAAFSDELEKIAKNEKEEKKAPQKWKNLAAYIAGSGLGYASAVAIHDAILQNQRMKPETKYQILGGLKMLGAIGTPYVVNKYLEHKAKTEKE